MDILGDGRPDSSKENEANRPVEQRNKSDSESDDQTKDPEGS